MGHWSTCWDTHVCQKLGHLDVGINARGRYHVAVVQNWHSFGRFDRQLTGHELDDLEVLRSNQLLKCEAYVP